MKTILVISDQAALPAALRAALDRHRYTLVHHQTIDEARTLLEHRAADVLLLDSELTSVVPIRLLEQVREFLTSCPVFLFTSASQWEWEEEAYLLGVSHVLSKPVRARLLNSLLDRLWSTPRPDAPAAPPPAPPAAEPRRLPVSTLEILRDFSTVLTHNLCAEALLKQFLLLLREIISVNRAAIFLRPPPGTLIPSSDPGQARRLRAACAIGIPSGLLEHFDLTLGGGIGDFLFRTGRILRRDSPDALRNSQTQKEFELLGGQVAIPILDRESIVGVAVFDGRLTGEPFSNEELSLIFHLLEELGVTVKNIWLHDQLAANHELIASVLRDLSSACIVISHDLGVLHANDKAREYFRGPEKRPRDFQFADLPQPLGSKAFEALKSGQPIPPFAYRPPGAPEKIFHVNITPFQKQSSASPTAVLVMVEDFTRIERLQQLEIEAANLRLTRQMAERLAHEIGNAVVPLSTHQQLLSRKIADPEFVASLEKALLDGVKRVTRLVSQLRFLASDRVLRRESLPVKQLVEDAFIEAHRQQPEVEASLQCDSPSQLLTVAGDAAGLRHALAEVILNAIQANPRSPQIKVRTSGEIDSSGRRFVRIEIEDNGGGFDLESSQRAAEPFYTTRNVGLGLGLAVTHRIVESHAGKLEIPPGGKHGIVRISLPVEAPAAPGQN